MVQVIYSSKGPDFVLEPIDFADSSLEWLDVGQAREVGGTCTLSGGWIPLESMTVLPAENLPYHNRVNGIIFFGR